MCRLPRWIDACERARMFLAAAITRATGAQSAVSLVSRPFHVALWLLIASALGAYDASAQQNYAATSIRVPGGDLHFIPRKGLTASGKVAGTVYFPSGEYHAFYFDGRTDDPVAATRDLDLDFFHNGISWITGINADGKAVGYALVDGGDTRAFLYNGAAVTYLDATPGTQSYANSINAFDQVVGGTEPATGGQSRAFLWENGVMVDLHPPGAQYLSSEAALINDAGLVIGRVATANSLSSQYMFSWTATGGTIVYPETLPGEVLFGAMAINAAGQVIGASYQSLPTNLHGFLFTPPPSGTFAPLPTLGGTTFPWDINNAGQVVGTATTAFFASPQHAFFSPTPLGAMVDLSQYNNSYYSNAFAINASGVVVGQEDGHAFVFDSAAATPAVVDLNTLVAGPPLYLIEANAVSDNGLIVATPQQRGSIILLSPVALTPEQAVQNVLASIDNMGLSNGVANSLGATLDNFNANNKTAACNKLDAFETKVDVKLAAGQLTSNQANQLLQAANAIKLSLGC